VFGCFVPQHSASEYAVDVSARDTEKLQEKLKTNFLLFFQEILNQIESKLGMNK